MEPHRIEHFDDPRIADYQNLKDAQLASRRDRFIVEGRGNLLVLLERSPWPPESLLLSERAWASLSDRLEALSVDCPVYLAERSVLDEIVGFPIHRGVLACCCRPEPADPLELAATLLTKEAAPRIVILEGLTNHDNVGGVFRNAMGLSGRAVMLCPRTADPLYRKAIRTSMGGSLVVPFARALDMDSMLVGLSELGFSILALDPAESGVDLAELSPEVIGPAAILLGTEGEGLTEGALARADRRVRIDMDPQVDSLNVSVASAIALHRLRLR